MIESRNSIARAALAIAIASVAAPAAAATVSINYTDSTGVGFKDTTPVSPVGGNTGTTLGNQRKQAFEFAANVWAQRLQSNVTVTIDANFTDQFCSPSSAQLGNAGPALLIPASGVPQANTYYPLALVNAIKGSDQSVGSDITAHFNKGIDTKPVGGCLGSTVFYYGLDQNNGGNVSFIDVAVHELGHGFGFVSLVNPSSGAAQFGDGKFGILDYSLFDETTSLALPSESNSQRAAVAISNGSLTWNNTNTNAGSAFLSAGSKTNGHVRMFAPSTVQSGSSVSHWDTVATPNLVMEPSYNALDAGTHVDLTTCAFKDIGWTLMGGFGCPDVAASGADLSVTKTDSPDPAIAGNNITYTITVHNNGPEAAQNVVVSDALPANLWFTSLAKPAGWAATTPPLNASGTVTLTNPSLASGASAVFTLVARAKADVLQGSTIGNTATVSSDTADPVPANNSSTSSTAINAQANLSLTNTDSPDPVFAGNSVTYTIRVTNAGPSYARTLTISDPLPANTTFVAAVTPAGWTLTAPAVGTNGTVSFKKGSLGNGASAQFTVQAKVIPNAADASTLSNTATASSTTTDPNAANNSATATTTVQRRADLSVTNTDSPDPVHVSQNLTYKVVVSSAGPSNASNVVLSDSVPANTTFVSNSGASGWACTNPAVGATGSISCTKGGMSPATSFTFTIVVNVNGATANGTVISSTPSVSSGTTDPTPANNSANAATTVSNP